MFGVEIFVMVIFFPGEWALWLYTMSFLPLVTVFYREVYCLVLISVAASALTCYPSTFSPMHILRF